MELMVIFVKMGMFTPWGKLDLLGSQICGAMVRVDKN
jgi:hypothetical protein